MILFYTLFSETFQNSLHFTTYNTIIFSTSSILNSQNSNIWILKTQLYINYPKTFSQNFTNIWNIYNNSSSYIIFKRFLKFIIYYFIFQAFSKFIHHDNVQLFNIFNLEFTMFDIRNNTLPHTSIIKVLPNRILCAVIEKIRGFVICQWG